MGPLLLLWDVPQLSVSGGRAHDTVQPFRRLIVRFWMLFYALRHFAKFDVNDAVSEARTDGESAGLQATMAAVMHEASLGAVWSTAIGPQAHSGFKQAQLV